MGNGNESCSKRDSKLTFNKQEGKKMWKKLFLTVFLVLSFVGVSIGGEVTIGLEWDANTETNLAGYKTCVSDVSGSGYIQFGNDIPAGTETVDFSFSATGTEAVKKFFVVTAFNDEGLESSYSNEVYWIYNFAPYELTASLDGDDIIFSWKQISVDLVKKWKLYYTETSGKDYQELAVIEYTGQEGPQYTITKTMLVPSGEIKTFYFVMVAFDNTVDPAGNIAFSENSNEVSIIIDKLPPAPVYNVTIKVKVQ